MPPRTRRRAMRQDENTPTVATTTMTTTPAGATVASPKKRSGLGLVLDNIVPHTSTPVRPHRPPHRAPKPVKRTTTTLSSLPPSSPPVPSSIAHAPTQRAYEGFMGPMEPVTPATQDDPFGFFAAERRLRERRQRLVDNPTRPPQPQQRNIELETQEDENINDDGRPAFATPPELQRLAESDPDFELDLSTLSGIHTPPGHTPDPRAVSPRHRRPKRKEIPPSPASSRSESPTRGLHGEQLLLPHTPSPMKRLSSSVPRRPFANIATQINSPVKATATTAVKKGKKGGKAKSGPPHKKYKTDETLAEEELKGITEELQELLPRRPIRKAAQSKGLQPQNTNTRKTAVPTTKPKPKSQKGKKTQAAKPRSKRAAAKHEEDDGEEFKEKEGESFVLSGEEREVCAYLH